MSSKTKAKSFALGLALVLALTSTPQALAGPSLGGNLGGAVYGFFSEIWQSLSSVIGPQEEAAFGPMVGPTGEAGNDFGPVATRNGLSSEAASEIGAGIIPNGDRSTLEEPDPDNEYGPYIIPNG